VIMKRQFNFRSLLVTASLLLAAAPAVAADWMIVGAEPDPAPHRSLYVMPADYIWITERLADDYSEKDIDASPNPLAAIDAKTLKVATVYQIFENAGGTNFIIYNVDFKCRDGLVNIRQATSSDRAGKAEIRTSSEWMKVPDNWLGKAEMIACGWKNWQAAWPQDIWPAEKSSKRKKGAERSVSLKSLGLEYLGDYNRLAITEVIDAVWNKHWPDAVQPPYYEGTREEKAASKAKLDAMHGEMKTLLSDALELSKVRTSLSDKAARMGGDAAREMGSVGGQTEQQVVARWGAPASAIESGGVRTLTYHYGKQQYGVANVQVDVLGPDGKVGETYEPTLTTSSRQCSRTLHLREMGAPEKAWRVFDFDASC
jgi:hypothetical protein